MPQPPNCSSRNSEVSLGGVLHNRTVGDAGVWISGDVDSFFSRMRPEEHREDSGSRGCYHWNSYLASAHMRM